MRRPHFALRVLSVLPFILFGAIAVIAFVAWIGLVVFGLGADQEAIWRWASGRSSAEVLAQVALAAGIGLGPVAVLLLTMWATMRGFGEQPALYFWLFAEIVFAALGLALVAGRTQWPGFMESIGLAGAQWWFAFAIVGYSMIVAHLRARGERRAATEEEDDG
ncbi:MAG: hypothetical protein WC709_12040 [Thermoleophilia bacterium]